METTFTRTDTKVIKGVAVLLMLMHHLFYFPDNRPYSMPEVRQILPNFMGQGLETMLGIFGVICVPIFFFLAGYGLYLQTRRDGFRLEKRILAVYTQYWKIFFIFIPIGFLFFRHQSDYCKATAYCHVFEQRGMQELFSALFCLKTPYNYEWWFLRGYVVFLVLGYVYLRLTEKMRNFWVELVVVLAVNFYGGNLLQFLMNAGLLPLDGPFLGLAVSHWNGALVLVGIVFAKYGVLDKWKARSVEKYTTLTNLLFSLTIIVGCFFLRLGDMSMNYDAILVPLFVLAVVTLLRLAAPLYKAAAFVGRYSTSLWLIHTFYLYYYESAAKLTHISGNLWVDYVILVAMTLVSAIAVERFWKCVPVQKLSGLLVKEKAA